MAEKLTQQIAFRVSQPIYNKLVALSVEANDRSMSDTARKLLEERLDERRLPPIEQIKNDLGDFLRDRVNTVDVLRFDLHRVQEQAQSLNQTCKNLGFDMRQSMNRWFLDRLMFFGLGVFTTVFVAGACFIIFNR